VVFDDQHALGGRRFRVCIDGFSSVGCGHRHSSPRDTRCVPPCHFYILVAPRGRCKLSFEAFFDTSGAAGGGFAASRTVTDAARSAKVKGRAHVAVTFESVSPAGEDERYAIETSSVGRTADATKKKDALEIGAPAAGGALIGALVGGKKGAVIGGAVGGGAGTAVVLSTRGKEVTLPRGSALTLRLTEPITVKLRS